MPFIKPSMELRSSFIMLILNLSALFFKILNWKSGIEFIFINITEVLASIEMSEI
jgi:hypothetical protein